MVSIRKNDDIQLSAFVVDSQFLHLYENKKRELIIKCLGAITGFCLNCNNGRWELCVASSNCVYRVTETDVREVLQSRQQSEKNDATVSNQEIFDDLLDDNIVHPFRGILHESSEAYIILEERFCILQENCLILCIAATDGHLWSLAQRENDFCLSGHRLTNPKMPETKVQLSPIITYLNIHCKYLSTEITKYNLHLVVSEIYAKCHNLASASVIISTRTFSALFGKEAALIDAPILLLSTPDGSVFFRQLAKQHSVVSDGWQILCETGNSVSYITCITLDKTENEDADLLFPTVCQQNDLTTDAIAVCCEMGKVVVAAADPTGDASYGSLAVQGPVSSWSCHGKHLFHGSGTSLFRTTVSREDGDHDERKGRSLFKIQTEMIHNISVSDMVHISGPLKPDECLLCYTSSGDMVFLETHPTDVSQGSGSLNIKELLVGLDYNNKRRECVQKQRDCLNGFLQQLNLASHLMSENKMNNKSRLIKSQCKVESLKNGYNREFHLSVLLTNQSSFTLSSDWSLDILLTLNNQSKTETESHDFSLSNGLKAKLDFELKIPLSKQFTMSASFKVVLHLVLKLDKSFLTTGTPAPLGVPLFLSSHSIDALCFIEEDSGSPSCCVSLNDALKHLAEDRIVGCSSRVCAMESCSNKVYSADVLLSSSSLPTHLLGGDYSSDKMLRFILEDSQINPECVQHGQGHFVDPSGNSLGLSVKKETSTDNSLTVSIRSNSLSLVAKCRMAVIHRLQVNATDVAPCSRKRTHKFLQLIEKLRESLQTIQDSYSDNSTFKTETIQSVCLFYHKLRQTNIQTVAI